MNKKNKIGIIVGYPPIKSDYDLYGIDIFKKNKINIFFIDISKILTPNLNYAAPRITNVCVKTAKNITELNNLLKEKNLIIISDIYLTIKTLFLYKLYKKNNTNYIVCDLFYHPLRTFSLYNTYNTYKTRITYTNILNKLLKYKKINNYLIQKATIALIPNNNSKILTPTINKKTKILFTHHPDYDKYLKTNHKKNKKENKTIVFLDQYAPYHPDYQVNNLKPETTPEKYYSSLSNFFDVIEKQTNLKVIIAAHPRSAKKKLFGKRKIFFNKTCELVKNAKLIIAHNSTSINFAALYKKPIIFITTNEFNKTIANKIIYLLSNCFNKIPININEYNINSDLKYIYSVNKQAYNYYISEHIKIPKTEKLNSWKILINYLKTTQII